MLPTLLSKNLVKLGGYLSVTISLSGLSRLIAPLQSRPLIVPITALTVLSGLFLYAACKCLSPPIHLCTEKSLLKNMSLSVLTR